MNITFIVGQEQIVKHYSSRPIYSELCATVQQHYGPGKIKFYLLDKRKTMFYDNYMLSDLFAAGLLPANPIHVEITPLILGVKAKL